MCSLVPKHCQACLETTLCGCHLTAVGSATEGGSAGVGREPVLRVVNSCLPHRATQGAPVNCCIHMHTVPRSVALRKRATKENESVLEKEKPGV